MCISLYPALSRPYKDKGNCALCSIRTHVCKKKHRLNTNLRYFTLENYQKSKKAAQRPEKAKSKMITLTLCSGTIIGHLSVSLALISVNLHQKYQKPKKAAQRPEKAKSEMLL